MLNSIFYNLFKPPWSSSDFIEMAEREVLNNSDLAETLLQLARRFLETPPRSQSNDLSFSPSTSSTPQSSQTASQQGEYLLNSFVFQPDKSYIFHILGPHGLVRGQSLNRQQDSTGNQANASGNYCPNIK